MGEGRSPCRHGAWQFCFFQKVKYCAVARRMCLAADGIGLVGGDTLHAEGLHGLAEFLGVDGPRV